MNTKINVVIVAFGALLTTTVATAQTQGTATTAASPNTGYRFSGSIRLRVEDYNWFATPKANGAYAFLGAQARAAITRQTSKDDFFLEFEAPALAGLPTKALASAPQGALGQGANYRSADGGQAATFFIRQGYMRFKHVGEPNTNVQLGRFEFKDGAETAAADPTLNFLKQNRIQERLIGPSNYTHVGRSFDGVEVTNTTNQHNATAFFGFPTRGIYDLNGWDTLTDIPIGYLAATNSHPGKNASGEERIFAIYYGDSRPDVLKVDNRPTAVRSADREGINIGTFGANILRTTKVGSGRLDALLWGAGQIGQWGSQKQGAYAYDAETGYQFGGWGTPWLRAGYSVFSGDGDAKNNYHGTFIPLEYSARPYARFLVYTDANIKDAFAALILKPVRRLQLRSEVHNLALANGADLWYTGTGAGDNSTFGYTGRPTSGKKQLGMLYDLSVDYQAGKHTSFTAYLGYLRGGDVISQIYAGKDAVITYFEATQRF